MDKKEYINKLKTFTESRGISIYDFYWYCARHVREKKNFSLPEFELQNPFLTTRDIQLLLNSSDSRIEEYFASAMTKVISSQQMALSKEEIREVVDEKLLEQKSEKKTMSSTIINREEIKNIINDKLNEVSFPKNPQEKALTKEDMKDVINEKLGLLSSVKGKLTSIGRKIADLLNGFAVIKEEKTGRTHLYHHDAKKDSLTGERVYLNNQFQVSSGYYVNYQEYLNHMISDFIDKNPTASNLLFVRDDGTVKNYNEVVEEAFAILSKNGIIRYGKSLVGKEFKTYREFRQLGIKGEEYYAGKPLKVGLYVRRDILTRIFARYKIRAIEKVNPVTKKQSVK